MKTTEEKIDVTKVISMTQMDLQLIKDEVALKQKAIDEKRIAELEAKFDALVGLNEELCNTIDEYKKKRAADINKACEWFGDYLMEIGYPDDWMRDSSVIESGEQRFRKVMEN